MTTRHQLRIGIARSFDRKQNRQQYQRALLGAPDGSLTVEERPGYGWARLGGVSGRLIQVYLRGTLPALDLPVIVAPLLHRPSDYGIVDLDVEGFAGTGTGETGQGWPGTFYLGAHGPQHGYLAGDPTYTHLRQWRPLRVYGNNGFIITVEQGFIIRSGVRINVSTQTLDLTSHIPASGVRYVLITLNATGTLTATNGAILSGTADLTLSDIPATPIGNFPLAAVRLYASQPSIRETPTAIDIVDLRWPQEKIAGVMAFTELSDTPDSYTDAANLFTTVVAGETGLNFRALHDEDIPASIARVADTGIFTTFYPTTDQTGTPGAAWYNAHPTAPASGSVNLWTADTNPRYFIAAAVTPPVIKAGTWRFFGLFVNLSYPGTDGVQMMVRPLIRHSDTTTTPLGSAVFARTLLDGVGVWGRRLYASGTIAADTSLAAGDQFVLELSSPASVTFATFTGASCFVGAQTEGTPVIDVPSGGGTVTSVGLSLPGVFNVTGSPVTTAGTLTATWTGQTAQYQVLVTGAGPGFAVGWSAGFLNIASGKTLTLTGSLTVGADASITGGGTLALGGFTATIPATGTAALGAGTLTVSTTNDTTGSTHTHAITASSNPGAAASILATTAAGALTTQTYKAADTTDSTSTTTGALQSAGGLGVAKAAHIGTLLGVGAIASTSVPINLAYTRADASGTAYLSLAILTSTRTGNGTATQYGMRFIADHSSTFNESGSLIGLFGNSRNLSTGTVAAEYGVQGIVTNISTGTITTAIGVDGAAQNAASGGAGTAMGTAIAMRAQVIQAATSGTITSALGLQVLPFSGAGITTAYGIQVQDQTAAATNYAIWTGTGQLYFGDKITTYNAIATVGNGVPSILAAANLVNRTDPITATTIYAVPTPGTGMYRISWMATITTAATTSSVLGGTNGFQIKFTDANDSVVKTSNPSTVINSSTNATGTTISGVCLAYCAANTNIQYLFDYTSVGATKMAYDLSIRVEALG